MTGSPGGFRVWALSSWTASREDPETGSYLRRYVLAGGPERA